MGSTMTDKTAPITRYCFRSEGMSDPPEQFESPTGDLVDYWDHLQIEKELLARIESLEAQLSARQAAPERWEPVWAVFRTRPDENGGKEFLHYAMWHNDTILSEGERYVHGHFVPGAAPPPPEREPLTDEQISVLGGGPCWAEDGVDIFLFARSIERAHGIGATND